MSLEAGNRPDCEVILAIVSHPSFTACLPLTRPRQVCLDKRTMFKSSCKINFGVTIYVALHAGGGYIGGYSERTGLIFFAREHRG